jgi:multicomponent Na+:H+ antiporter subunit D
LFNAIGMLFYQLGMILLYTSLGTLNITLLTERLALVPHSQLLRLARVFLMVAIGVKSAFFPVYTWLPRAHSAAPTAISALLSGLLVKSGLYAFIRMESMFPLPDLNEFFFWLGLLSAVSGTIFALSQSKLKSLLAYSTVSQIGLIVMGVSHPGTVLYLGGITHLFNHALIKCLLFLCAGIVIKGYGKSRIRTIRGVFRTMPLLSIAMIIGMVSITGGFLTNGYMSKSLLSYGLEDKVYMAQIIYHVVNLGTIAYFLKMSSIFFGPAQPDVKKPSGFQLAAVSILAATCLVIPWINDSLWAYFGQDLPHISLFKGSKAILYESQILIGLGLARWLLKGEPRGMKTIRDFQFGFGASNGLMLLFLLMMTMASKLI